MNVIPPVEEVLEAKESSELGVEVPRPKRVFVLSQKKLILFCAIAPPVDINGTDPEVRPVIAKVVVVALVVVDLEKVAFVANRLVDDANVENRVVEVALVNVALVDPRLVLVPLVKNPLVENRLVEVALVIIDEVAKRFCENRLRKRSDEEPRDPPRSVPGVMLPATWSLSVGLFVPRPSLWLVLLQKKLLLFCEIRPFAPMNGTDPAVSEVR